MTGDATAAEDGRHFTPAQVAGAETILRAALDLPPRRLDVAQAVAALSAAIEQLRAAGFSDERVAAMLHEAIGAEITAAEIGRHYVPPAGRHPR
ncbi:hypothetical protein LPC08_06060 [Roseomonas sp. OT10]|uniref:hypothetical protein n=1 Tax=Roseomonas cutis TaxID=2897332 RepID=UPI001E4937A0|nr:hypothetical protein [Roseomonas sp. OT10]UFN50187.1 hypothetical protein LPC08_06060 [Roseomonas sp. OT10]